MYNWTSVEDGLPEVMRTVLVVALGTSAHKGKDVREGWLSEDGWYCLIATGVGEMCIPEKIKVTHWMPHPDPPTKEQL